MNLRMKWRSNSFFNSRNIENYSQKLFVFCFEIVYSSYLFIRVYQKCGFLNWANISKGKCCPAADAARKQQQLPATATATPKDPGSQRRSPALTAPSATAAPTGPTAGAQGPGSVTSPTGPDECSDVSVSRGCRSAAPTAAASTAAHVGLHGTAGSSAPVDAVGIEF